MFLVIALNQIPRGRALSYRPSKTELTLGRTCTSSGSSFHQQYPALWKKILCLNTMDDSEDDWLSLKPQEPLPAQCCGSGCKPCIYDVYQKELEQWEEAKAKRDRSLLTRKKPQCKNSELAPEMFTAFTISSVDQLTEDTYQYKFELPGNSSLGLSLGQHIVLRGLVNDLEIQRAYTPITPVNTEGYFDVLIKCYEDGLMSQYVKSWKQGESVFWRGPFGGFPYRPNHEHSLENLPWSYQKNTHLGRMNEYLLRSMLNSCRRHPFVLICGSGSFVNDMEGYLKAIGLQEDSYFVF
ncbi:NADH-cytochrome b5 reductase-like isoform X6 [Paroedura picta]|uniref:NADH-cytochrome b5 reductase-like isoform X6 n=1 Tax=Paroedura picta TaxID=143630 RepID=UPI0040566144